MSILVVEIAPTEAQPKRGIDDVLAAEGPDAVHALIQAAVPFKSRRQTTTTADSAAVEYEKSAARTFSDVQLSEHYVDAFDGRYKHNGGWWHYEGTHWARDLTGSVVEVAKQVGRGFELAAHELRQTARKERNVEEKKRINAEAEKLEGHARRACSAAGIRAGLELAKSVPEIAFTDDDADSDSMLLATQSGTVDLRTGELRPSNPADLITRCCPVAYDPTAKAPRFEAFLEQVQRDGDVRSYLARFIGYAATGRVHEHVIGVLWGPGANGKSVFADVVTHVLGEYSKPGPPSLIVRSPSGQEPHPTDIASCHKARLVIVHETRRGAGFDASKVKLLTGGDRLTARYMRQDFFSFQPTHKLLMLSNYKPKADASDEALWRRLQLVPFDVVIPKAQRDPELSARIIAEESAGVLRWIVDGCIEWQRIGLRPPQLVLKQTEEYRSDEDIVGAFIRECCVKESYASVRGKELYMAYRAFCESQGYRPRRNNEFATEILRHGVEKERDRKGALYRGIGLEAAHRDDGRTHHDADDLSHLDFKD